jgi:hypothetical protein
MKHPIAHARKGGSGTSQGFILRTVCARRSVRSTTCSYTTLIVGDRISGTGELLERSRQAATCSNDIAACITNSYCPARAGESQTDGEITLWETP